MSILNNIFGVRRKASGILKSIHIERDTYYDLLDRIDQNDRLMRAQLDISKGIDSQSDLLASRTKMYYETIEKELVDRLETANHNLINKSKKYEAILDNLLKALDDPTRFRYKKHLEDAFCRERSEMPQIDSDVMDEVIEWLDQEYGGEFINIAICDIIPGQSEINDDKVLSMITTMDKLVNRKIIISKDNYLPDGNHWWAALMEIDPYYVVRVYRPNVPMVELLRILHAMFADSSKDINDQKVELEKGKSVAEKHASMVWILDTRRQRVLVIRRSKTDPWRPLQWYLPGGTLRLNSETPYQGAVRETKEETGIKLDSSKLQLIGLYNKDDWHTYSFIASVDVIPEVTLDNEHDRFKWVSIDDVAQLDDSVDEMKHHVGFLTKYLESVASGDIVKAALSKENMEFAIICELFVGGNLDEQQMSKALEQYMNLFENIDIQKANDIVVESWRAQFENLSKQQLIDFVNQEDGNSPLFGVAAEVLESKLA